MAREIKKTLSDKTYDLIKDILATYAKKEFALQLEKHVTKRVKKELRKEFIGFGAAMFLFVGMGFFIYALFGLIVTVLEVPSMMTQLFFGVFLIFLAMLLFVFRP